MPMRKIPEKQFAEMITWVMCAMAKGGGIGKCDPEHCVCGAEGRIVAGQIYGNGYGLVEFTKALKSNDHSLSTEQ